MPPRTASILSTRLPPLRPTTVQRQVDPLLFGANYAQQFVSVMAGHGRDYQRWVLPVGHSVILQVGTMSFTSPTPFLFVRSVLLNPRAMGALAPSSPKLSQLMASLVDPANSPVL